MQILEQLIFGSIFIIVAIICLTIPFLYLFKKIRIELDDLESLTLASVFGIVIFTLAAYILAALHFRFLMWLFPIFGIWTLFKLRNNLLKINFNLKFRLFFLLIFFIGVIGQVAVNAPSGFPYQDGIYFWSSHGHDGVWHVALMEEMKKNNFPFQNPELAGQNLQNYHFFSDLLMSEFSRLFNFSTLDIYFRFMPVIFSILLGLTSFIFVRRWSKNEIAGIWAMIFTYFAGSFGYLLYVPTHQSLGGEAIFWVSQTQSVLGNPPHTTAFIIVTAFLFCLYQYLKKRDLVFFILCALLGGAVIEFKVYGGLLILGGLLLLGIYELILKKTLKVIYLFLLTFLIAFLIYYPNSANSSDFLIWQPWWYIRTMVVAPDRLNWLDLELKRQTYIAEGNWKRVVQVELMAFLIFLFGNLGMRFLGFLTIFSQLRQNILKSSFNLFFLIITSASFIIPVLFLQKGVAWNSIQFNQYFLLLFGFWAAMAVPGILNLFRSIYWKTLITILIIILAIPTQLGLLWQFYSNAPLSKLSYQELEALTFLKNKKEEVTILTASFNRFEKDKYKNPPIPIYAWYDTGYVAAFSTRRTFVSDQEQLTIMGYDVDRKLAEREMIFASKNYQEVNDFLRKYNIDYVYLVFGQKFATDSADLKVEPVFENRDAKIFKVKK